tara:strand:- start:11 stop:115 length:105 start_codon:yes stop_codon:yes gene_type:complete
MSVSVQAVAQQIEQHQLQWAINRELMQTDSELAA